jgi:hypothetical protein
MVARLGNVLYWLGCGTAVLFAVWAFANVWVLMTGSTAPGENAQHIVVSAVCAAFAWLTGRACRYVLAGT